MDVTKGQEVIAIAVRDQLRAENDEENVGCCRCTDVMLDLVRTTVFFSNSESKQRLDNLQCDLFAEASSWSPGVKM